MQQGDIPKTRGMWVPAGHTNIATSQSRTNTAYGTLTTPDQVSATLVTDGLVRVYYQALWQESVAGAARAAIFIESAQLSLAAAGGGAEAAATASGGTATDGALFTVPWGLASTKPVGGTGVPSLAGSGQAIGACPGIGTIAWDLNGAVQSITGNTAAGGACVIAGLTAGTYAISIRFKASSGSVAASDRHLWVDTGEYP